MAAMSHSPRLAAASPPVLPTLSAFTEIPSDCNHHIEPNAVAADNHEIGKVRPADQLYLDRCAGGHALDMLADRDEPIGLAKSCYSTRALGIGVGGERSFTAGAN